MATWTIIGQAGKRLNSTERTFASLGLESPHLKFDAGGDDEFTFVLPITTTAGAGIDGVNRIPEAGQDVEVFRNGVRKFKGQAMFPGLTMSEAQVKVLGPNHWMRRLPVLGESGMAVDSATDADGTRPVVVFPQQGLRESFRTLINAARDAGVPIQNIGTDEVGDFISTMFTMLKITLSGKSWADALNEMLKWCLDAVRWYDYTTATAKLNITRRGSMTPLTLTVGDDILENGFRIWPELELEAGEVSLEYMTRHPTTGRHRVARQKYGSSATKKQLVVVSGTDFQDLSLPDDLETASIRTMDTATPDSDYVADRAGTISSLIEANGRYGSVARSVSGYDGTSWEVAKRVTRDFGAMKILNLDGTAATTSGKYLVLSPDYPEWFSKAPIRAKKVKIRGAWLASYRWGSSYSETDPPPAGWMQWYNAAPFKDQWWYNEKVLSSDDPIFMRWFAVPWECDGVLVSVEYPTKTTVYEPWLWDFLTPPPSLAENLYNSSNWTRWSGTIPVHDDDVTGDNLLNRKIRVANWLPECADMDALLKSVDYDIYGNVVTYSLGGTPAVDYRNLIGRTMSQRPDRIVLL